MRGCTIGDLALWETSVAYLMRSVHRGTCAKAHKGAWIRTQNQPPRRLSARADRLGDLRDGWVTWFDSVSPSPPVGVDGSGDRWRLRASPLVGSPETVAGGNDDCCWLEGGRLDGGFIYFRETVDLDVAQLTRARIGSTRDDCQERLDRTFGSVFRSLGPVVDAGRVFYIEFDLGVVEVSPDDLKWGGC